MLDLKYRPDCLEDVLGNQSLIKSVAAAIKAGEQRFLFTGASGIGKTTIARIVAKDIGSRGTDIVEIDGATTRGIDAIREEVLKITPRCPMMSEKRCFIIDEAHSLTPEAIEASLKTVEEPGHNVFIFCTTEPHKIKDTIKTRMQHYAIPPIPTDQIIARLKLINEKEGMEIPDQIIALAAKRCRGGMRQAINYMSQARGCKTVEEAGALFYESAAEAQALDLAKKIKAATHFEDGFAVLNQAKDMIDNKKLPTDGEKIRVVIFRWLGAVLFRSNASSFHMLAHKVQCFSKAYHPAAPNPGLALSIAECFAKLPKRTPPPSL